MSRGSLVTLAPLPHAYNADAIETCLFVGDDGALVNIVVRGEGALYMKTLMLNHRFIQTINLLRSFFWHLSKTQIRGYAFVAVALQGRPMNCITGGKGRCTWGHIHVLRISCRLQVIRMSLCILVMCGAREAIMRFMKDVRILWVLLERRKYMY